jgi:hypothetical protein
MQWFEEKGITRGDPETLQQDYASCKLKLVNIGNFQGKIGSSLMGRRVANKMPFTL